LRSDLLASAITEKPARVRLLGKSQMMALNATAFVVLTGNGLTVSEDLARRFVTVELDPRTENPESRSFKIDVRREVIIQRKKLLGALLTIWRWGRVATAVEAGLSLGSFDQWCRWVRDPLLSLGCQDPAARIREAKERDDRRQSVANLYNVWWERHGEAPVALRNLHPDIVDMADPQGRGRQYLSSFIERLVGTRMAGFVLSHQRAVGDWGVITYALKETPSESHRVHRGDRSCPEGSDAPDAPDESIVDKAA